MTNPPTDESGVTDAMVEVACLAADRASGLDDGSTESLPMRAALKAALSHQGEVVPIRRDVYEFLLGTAPLNGMWFGESSEIGRPYWWRHDLTALISKAEKAP